MSFLRIASAILVLSMCATAAADQCQVIDRAVADRATAAIRTSHGRVIRYCAPCGDTMPPISAAFTPSSVTFDGSELHVDGRTEDLAYLYLEVAPNVFENFALRAGCPASDIPEALRYLPSGPTVHRFGPVPPALASVGWGRSVGPN
jgi:hypothetical protein